MEFDEQPFLSIDQSFKLWYLLIFAASLDAEPPITAAGMPAAMAIMGRYESLKQALGRVPSSLLSPVSAMKSIPTLRSRQLFAAKTVSR